MLQYKPLCLLLTTTQTSRRLCLLLEGCPKKSFSVVVSWRSSFHRKNRLAEKSFSVVGRQQAEGLVVRSAPEANHEWKALLQFLRNRVSNRQGI